MKVIVYFLKLINIHTVVVMALSCAATYLCLRLKWIIDLPTGLIGIAIVFPIVFSINAAYRRREEALRYFASLKAHAVALFYAHRDWVPEETAEHANRMKGLIDELLRSMYQYFTGKENDQARFEEVYGRFSAISSSMEDLRDADVSNSEISRCNQYLRAMMIDFERMKNIHLYRTPKSLRAYSQVFLNSFPVLFAPYFAHISNKFLYGSGFLVAIIYSLVLVCLDNIQEDLEHPYDQVGEDDLKLNVTENYGRILNRNDL